MCAQNQAKRCVVTHINSIIHPNASQTVILVSRVEETGLPARMSAKPHKHTNARSLTVQKLLLENEKKVWSIEAHSHLMGSAMI